MNPPYPPFQPDNYPRTYRPIFEIYAGLYLAGAFIFIVCLCYMARTAIQAHQLSAAFHNGGIAVIYILAAAVYFNRSPRIKLYADRIEVFNGLLRFSMKRDDIKGTRWVGDHVVLLPKNEKGKYITVPLLFKVDEYYDAWIATLPYLSSHFSGQKVNDETPVEVFWDSQQHCWRPIRRKITP